TKSILCCAALAMGLGGASCSERRAWQDPDWQRAQPAQRIVAASVLAVESLLEVMPRERLVGVHTFAADANYSLVADMAKALPLLGASPEQLLSVRPDLVIVDAFTRGETLSLLAAANVPVVRTNDPHSFADIEANLRLLGRVAHLQPEVEGIIAATNRKLASVRLAGKDLS